MAARDVAPRRRVGRHTIGSDEARNGTAVPVWEILLQIAADVPDEELAKIPHDAAEQHDHYLYGAPKRASSREPAHR